jgi:rare lipoprotein A
MRARWIAWLLLLLAAAGCATGRVSRGDAVGGLERRGIASWYGRQHQGKPTASGEIYDMNGFTAAHRTLPFGTWVRVTNLANGRSVDVRINDRGPWVDGRIIDLSYAAARRLEAIGPGLVRVELTILQPPPD